MPLQISSRGTVILQCFIANITTCKQWTENSKIVLNPTRFPRNFQHIIINKNRNNKLELESKRIFVIENNFHIKKRE